MHDAARMRMLERRGHVDEHGQDLGIRRAAHLPQVAARGQHHRQHGVLAGAHRLEHPQNARMVEPRRQREFALEHLPGGFRIREL